MKTLFVFCRDLATQKICNKYSEGGLGYQDEEYKGNLNFSKKEEFEEWVKEMGQLNCDFFPSIFPERDDFSVGDEDEFDNVLVHFGLHYGGWGVQE